MGRGYSAEYDYCRLWVTYCSRRQLGHNFNDHNTAIIRTPKKTLVSVLKILCLKNNMQKNRRGTTICYLHWSQEVFYGPCLTEANTRLSKFTQLSNKATFYEMCNVHTVLERSWNSIINFPFQNLQYLVDADLSKLMPKVIGKYLMSLFTQNMRFHENTLLTQESFVAQAILYNLNSA